MNLYNERLSEMETKRATDAATLASKYAQTAEEREQACLDMAKQKEMDIEGWKVTANSEYNKQTSECTVSWVNHICNDWDSGSQKCDTGEDDHTLENCYAKYDMLTGEQTTNIVCQHTYNN